MNANLLADLHDVGRMGREDGPGDDRFGVALTYLEGVAHVALVGELDLASVPRFEAVVAAAFVRADRCVIDFGALEFVDSSGIRALLRARRRAAESGGTIEFAHATPAVTRVLADAGVEHVLDSAD